MTLQEKDFLYKVGRNIAKLKRAKGLSQLDVCVIIDMDKSILSSIENGRQNFTTLTLLKISQAINTPVSEFFNY